ncbi:MAG: hypothetical protein JWR88_41, partial [Pseudonocardia sp.]|nr:hypothetical protein [Pseudonocardia sp.]
TVAGTQFSTTSTPKTTEQAATVGTRTNQVVGGRADKGPNGITVETAAQEPCPGCGPVVSKAECTGCTAVSASDTRGGGYSAGSKCEAGALCGLNGAVNADGGGANVAVSGGPEGREYGSPPIQVQGDLKPYLYTKYSMTLRGPGKSVDATAEGHSPVPDSTVMRGGVDNTGQGAPAWITQGTVDSPVNNANRLDWKFDNTVTVGDKTVTSHTEGLTTSGGAFSRIKADGSIEAVATAPSKHFDQSGHDVGGGYILARDGDRAAVARPIAKGDKGAVVLIDPQGKPASGAIARSPEVPGGGPQKSNYGEEAAARILQNSPDVAATTALGRYIGPVGASTVDPGTLRSGPLVTGLRADATSGYAHAITAVRDSADFKAAYEKFKTLEADYNTKHQAMTDLEAAKNTAEQTAINKLNELKKTGALTQQQIDQFKKYFAQPAENAFNKYKYAVLANNGAADAINASAGQQRALLGPAVAALQATANDLQTTQNAVQTALAPATMRDGKPLYGPFVASTPQQQFFQNHSNMPGGILGQGFTSLSNSAAGINAWDNDHRGVLDVLRKSDPDGTAALRAQHATPDVAATVGHAPSLISESAKSKILDNVPAGSHLVFNDSTYGTDGRPGSLPTYLAVDNKTGAITKVFDPTKTTVEGSVGDVLAHPFTAFTAEHQMDAAINAPVSVYNSLQEFQNKNKLADEGTFAMVNPAKPANLAGNANMIEMAAHVPTTEEKIDRVAKPVVGAVMVVAAAVATASVIGAPAAPELAAGGGAFLIGEGAAVTTGALMTGDAMAAGSLTRTAAAAATGRGAAIVPEVVGADVGTTAGVAGSRVAAAEVAAPAAAAVLPAEVGAVAAETAAPGVLSRVGTQVVEGTTAAARTAAGAVRPVAAAALRPVGAALRPIGAGARAVTNAVPWATPWTMRLGGAYFAGSAGRDLQQRTTYNQSTSISDPQVFGDVGVIAGIGAGAAAGTARGMYVGQGRFAGALGRASGAVGSPRMANAATTLDATSMGIFAEQISEQGVHFAKAPSWAGAGDFAESVALIGFGAHGMVRNAGLRAQQPQQLGGQSGRPAAGTVAADPLTGGERGAQYNNAVLSAMDARAEAARLRDTTPTTLGDLQQQHATAQREAENLRTQVEAGQQQIEAAPFGPGRAEKIFQHAELTRQAGAAQAHAEALGARTRELEASGRSEITQRDINERIADAEEGARYAQATADELRAQSDRDAMTRDLTARVDQSSASAVPDVAAVRQAAKPADVQDVVTEMGRQAPGSIGYAVGGHDSATGRMFTVRTDMNGQGEKTVTIRDQQDNPATTQERSDISGFIRADALPGTATERTGADTPENTTNGAVKLGALNGVSKTGTNGADQHGAAADGSSNGTVGRGPAVDGVTNGVPHGAPGDT